MLNRKRQFFASAVAVLMLASDALAQAGDWQAVQNLPPKTLISVKTRQRDLCWVEQVTATDLTGHCYRPLRWASVTFDRADIREVRLERDQRKSMRTGAIVGAGVGVVAGATTGKGPRSGRVLVLTPGGAMIGAVAGGIVNILRRGQLIYKR